MTIKGYPDQAKSDDGKTQFVTVGPVREQQHGLDVIAHIFHQDIATDLAEANSTTRTIVATAHEARVGDLISWTSGNLASLEYRVSSIPSANEIGIAEVMAEAPGVGDGFTIMRPKTPRVSDDGELTVGVTFSNDTDYGVVGANTQRTAAQIGNATGAADFGAGNSSAQTLRVVVATNQLSLPVDDDGGSLTVDDGGSTLSVDDGGGSITVDGTVASSNWPSTVATDSGASSSSTPRVVLATRHEAAATPVSVRKGNGTGFDSYNAGAADSTTPRVVASQTNIAYQAKGKISGASLTGTYATLLNPTSDLRVIYLLNSCNASILVSLDGGTTDTFELEPSESVTVDLGANGMKFDNAVNISAKHNGSAPTSGSIRCTGIS